MDLFKLVYLGTLYPHGDPPSSPPPLVAPSPSKDMFNIVHYVGHTYELVFDCKAFLFIIVTFNTDLFDWEIVAVELCALQLNGVFGVNHIWSKLEISELHLVHFCFHHHAKKTYTVMLNFLT